MRATTSLVREVAGRANRGLEARIGGRNGWTRFRPKVVRQDRARICKALLEKHNVTGREPSQTEASAGRKAR